MCLELALQWLVSQWRGVSQPLDCCLTSRQTEHIGSGWTETPAGRDREREREGEEERRTGGREKMGRKGKMEPVVSLKEEFGRRKNQHCG